MKISGLKGFIDSQPKPVKAVAVFLGLIFFAVLVVFLIRGLSGRNEGTIDPDQILIQKGDKTIIINANGLIEYRSVSGVFYEVWDNARIQSFFEAIQEAAKAYLANPNSSICNTGYTVTLYLDGKEVTVCIAGDNPLLEEAFNEFPGEGGDEIVDIVDEFFDQDQGPTPTPTPLVVSAEEGGDTGGGGGGGGGGSQQVIACGLYQENVSDRTVISNVLCINSPTPTPMPTPIP